LPVIGAPAGNGYTKIYSNRHTFAVLEADGSITAWGTSGDEGTGAPSGKGYTKIYSNWYAFAALAPVPPQYEAPHAVIDPSALRAAKAPQFE
jgi:ribosomal protein S24E